LNLFKTVHVVYIEEKKLVMFAASLGHLQITKLLVDEEEEVERQEAHRFTFKKGEKGRKEP
jgi:hypothetical protein